MKIGILTHHYINNFGAFLQAYALQTALQEMYPNDEVQIIDCMNVKHFVINAGGWFRFYKNKETLSDWLQKIKLPITFAKARKKYMALTPTCYNAKDIEKLGLDYIVVGSDEVWNYQETKGNAKVKFGVGLEKEKLVAYAIIAANAAVVKDVRENEVVGGVPAKTIGENVEHKLYFGENEGIRK